MYLAAMTGELEVIDHPNTSFDDPSRHQHHIGISMFPAAAVNPTSTINAHLIMNTKNQPKSTVPLLISLGPRGLRAVWGRWHFQYSVRAVRNAQDTAPGDTRGKPGSLRGAGEVGVTMHSLGGPQTRQECI